MARTEQVQAQRHIQLQDRTCDHSQPEEFLMLTERVVLCRMTAKAMAQCHMTEISYSVEAVRVWH